MKDIFSFHNNIIDGFSSFSRSFTRIKAPDIRKTVDGEYEKRRYWLAALVQINPNYRKDASVEKLVKEGTLHPLCAKFFPATPPWI